MLGTTDLATTGTVELSASYNLGDLGTLTGDGTLIVDSGDVLDLGGGTLVLGAGGGFDTVLLAGAITDGTVDYEGQGGVLLNGGSIDSAVTTIGTNSFDNPQTLTGDTNLASTTLDIAVGTGTSNIILDGGDVRDGTIRLGGGLLTFSDDPTLDAVTILGTLAVGVGTLNVSNGLTGSGLDGSGPGVITLNVRSDALSFSGDETLNNVLVVVAGTSPTYFYQQDGGTLTFASTSTLVQQGGSLNINDYYAISTFDNEGTWQLSNGTLNTTTSAWRMRGNSS